MTFGAGVVVTAKADPVTEEDASGSELVLEIRSASLGIWDGDFTLGVPPLPFSIQGIPPIMLPGIYLFRRLSQQGFAKLQLWVYDAASKGFVAQSEDLWGHSFYNRWWWFGVGPFDGSNDIEPDLDLVSHVPGGGE